MLAVIPFGGDATTAGASEWRVQGLHDAHDAHDGVIVSYRDALCIVVPCYAIGIHWVFPRAALRLLLRCSSEDFLNQCIRRDPAERLSATDPWQLNPRRISLIFFAENEFSGHLEQGVEIVEIESFWAMPAGSVGYPISLTALHQGDAAAHLAQHPLR